MPDAVLTSSGWSTTSAEQQMGPSYSGRNTNMSMHSLPPDADFHAPIAPLIGGTMVSERVIDPGASQFTAGFRIAFPADIYAGAEALMGKYDTMFIPPGMSLFIPLASAITLMCGVGVASATNTGGNAVITSESALANVQAALIQFDFNAADAIRGIIISTSQRWSTDRYMLVSVTGVSYA